MKLQQLSIFLGFTLIGITVSSIRTTLYDSGIPQFCFLVSSQRNYLLHSEDCHGFEAYTNFNHTNIGKSESNEILASITIKWTNNKWFQQIDNISSELSFCSAHYDKYYDIQKNRISTYERVCDFKAEPVHYSTTQSKISGKVHETILETPFTVGSNGWPWHYMKTKVTFRSKEVMFQMVKYFATYFGEEGNIKSIYEDHHVYMDREKEYNDSNRVNSREYHSNQHYNGYQEEENHHPKHYDGEQDYDAEHYYGEHYYGEHYGGGDYDGEDYDGEDYDGEDYDGEDYEGEDYYGEHYYGGHYYGGHYNGEDYDEESSYERENNELLNEKHYLRHYNGDEHYEKNHPKHYYASNQYSNSEESEDYEDEH